MWNDVRILESRTASAKTYVWINIVAFFGLVFVAIFGGIDDHEPKRSDVPRTQPSQVRIAASEPSIFVEPAIRWPECSLPLYPIKEASSRRVVSATRAEIVYETHWVRRLDDADRNEFEIRAKRWTPECRMLAIKSACAPHCFNEDAYVAIIESAADLAEGKTLLGTVLAINEAELKHARVAIADMKTFVAYTKTIVPHSSGSVGGRECFERMRRDKQRVNDMEEQVKGRFAFAVVGMSFGHARMCVSCDESANRQRYCKWMHEELANGGSQLHDAEKELVRMRRVMAR